MGGHCAPSAPRPRAGPAESRSGAGPANGPFGGSVAVVSGRPLAELDHHLQSLVLGAAGAHGVEQLPDSRRLVEAPFTRPRAPLSSGGMFRSACACASNGPPSSASCSVSAWVWRCRRLLVSRGLAGVTLRL
jgi:hypothetical protein